MISLRDYTIYLDVFDDCIKYNQEAWTIRTYYMCKRDFYNVDEDRDATALNLVIL